MSTKKRGLGKGLNELLSSTLGTSFTVVEEEKAKHGKEIFSLTQIPTEALHPGPFQPRKEIQHDTLEELAESIRAQGIIQPIVVRESEKGYDIIAGERRWRAAQLVGLEQVPVIIRKVTDEAAMAIALIENIQRQDLNPIEEALALKRLTEDLQLTHLQIAEAVGKSRTSVTNCLRLLTLNPQVQTLLESGQIEMGHARALLGLKSVEQLTVAQKVVELGLSVRETEKRVSQWQMQLESPEAAPVRIDPNIRHLEENLADKLGAKVKIRHGRRGHGVLVIHYHDVDELEGILAHFK